MSKKRFDVIVVGGGHAGVEAAGAAARMGSEVALVTMDASKIGAMHCNPSVGGLGKGHLVYEVAALGGIMPQLCSKTYLQAKMLNTKKGPAVQGLRLQIDKLAYQRLASQTMQDYPGVTVLEDEVIEVLHQGDGCEKKVDGIVTKKEGVISAPCVIITAGTFLNSAIWVGKKRVDPFKSLNPSSNSLTKSIESLIGLKLGRMKTGTPPRVSKSSLDFSKFQYHKSHVLDYLFEFDPVVTQEKAACFMVHTNEKTFDVIAQNLDEAGYNPDLEGMEPRYCPSLETKLRRFPDRKSHHVFIEPESLELDDIYPAGLSNSLPADVQEEMIRTISGFENAVMTKPGFMIEYDFLQPRDLKATLEHKKVKGFFLAGQVNGTTGYEEAASQGIIAGINAHLVAREKDPFVLSRTESYIGVMVDDLISLGVDEPYRMFTSRAEMRLSLRQDNVFERLSPKAFQLGLISNELFEKFEKEQEATERAFSLVKEKWKHGELFRLFHSVEFLPEIKVKVFEILKEKFSEKKWDIYALSARSLLSLHARVRYDGYLDREQQEIKKLTQYAAMKIPKEIDYSSIDGLSVEVANKLSTLCPETIAQAKQIPGITPAAISILIFRVSGKKKH